MKKLRTDSPNGIANQTRSNPFKFNVAVTFRMYVIKQTAPFNDFAHGTQSFRSGRYNREGRTFVFCSGMVNSLRGSHNIKIYIYIYLSSILELHCLNRSRSTFTTKCHQYQLSTKARIQCGVVANIQRPYANRKCNCYHTL